MKETPVQQRIRLDAFNHGCELWRNNVGALPDVNGRWVRYGLLNDSKKMNEKIKSSDLIGVTTITITPDMIGQRVAVFTAIETKASDWTYSQNDKRSVAQKVFHDIVKKAGGFAGFATSVQDFKRIIGK